MTNFSEPYKIICDVFFKSSHSERFGKTKLGLAQYLGISQGKAQGWEKGTWPKAEDLRTIHEKLGFNYGWLVTGEGEPFESAPEAVAPSVTLTAPPVIAGLEQREESIVFCQRPTQPVLMEFAVLQAEVVTLRAKVSVLTDDLLHAQRKIIDLHEQLQQITSEKNVFLCQREMPVVGTGAVLGAHENGRR